MKRELGVMLFTLAVVILVALVVFSTGNTQMPPRNTTSGNVSQNTSNSLQGNQNSSQNLTQPANKVTAAELASHNSQEDCWISYKNEVYDITNWLPKHPGSAEAIAPYCGTSEEFENAFKGQHGESQVNKLKEEGTFKGELE